MPERFSDIIALHLGHPIEWTSPEPPPLSVSLKIPTVSQVTACKYNTMKCICQERIKIFLISAEIASTGTGSDDAIRYTIPKIIRIARTVLITAARILLFEVISTSLSFALILCITFYGVNFISCPSSGKYVIYQ